MQTIKYSESFTYDLSKSLGVELIADLEPDEYIVTIVFENQKFFRVESNFITPYTREHWKIFAIIENEIKQLEKHYATNSN